MLQRLLTFIAICYSASLYSQMIKTVQLGAISTEFIGIEINDNEILWVAKFPLSSKHVRQSARHSALITTVHKAEEFLKTYSTKEMTLRLPTEKEWELFAGISQEPYYPWKQTNDAEDYCWHNQNTKSSQPFGLRQPNSRGIYEVYGNHWEFLSTPHGPYNRKLRGGCFRSGVNETLFSTFTWSMNIQNPYTSFRPVFTEKRIHFQ